jgi:hypothetical protein
VDDDVEHMLTTIDNPWNPFTNYDEWWQFDRAHGYDTPGFLARIANVSLDLSDADQELAIEEAISEICQLNVNGLYTRATRPINAAA